MVFYLPGFDPFPPRRYRELYRKEGAEQARVSGYELQVLPRGSAPGFGWSVASEIDGVAVHAEIEVLVWSDLVQRTMAHGIVMTYVQLARTAWIYIASGALFSLMRLRKGPVVAALYPVAALLLQLLVAVGLGAVILRAGPASPVWVTAIPAALAVWGVLRLFQRLDRKFYAYYLMHDYAHSASLRGANPADLEERLAVFRERVAVAMAEDWDEVLIVGHSSGAHLAVQVLAQLSREERLPETGSVGFLSLGQVVPMVSFLPDAHALRADLALMASQERVAWVDVSAPGDGCSFALCDPVIVSGVSPPDRKWPLVISASFTKTLSADHWNSLKRRYLRLHFQYLCAFDRPGDYDYFQITAGPLSLKDRFAGRAPSPSRIETPVNRYTSVAA